MIVERLQEALRHHQAGQFDRAVAIYRRVLEIEPEQPDAWHLWGLAEYAKGRFGEARERIARAIELKPAEAVFYGNLGAVLESLDRPAEAEASYRRSLALNPRHASALNNLGNIYRAAWRLDEAADHYRRAIAIRPHFASAHGNLGTVFADQRRFDDAIQCYRRAIELDGSFFPARKNLVTSLVEQGQYGEARAELARARALWPDDAGLKIRSALLLPAIPESVAAIDACRRDLDADLDRLLADNLEVSDPLADTPGPAFYLAYHGRNDVDLQRKIAAVYARAVPSLTFTAPHCTRARKPGRIMRVGLISRFFHQHSIADHYAGILRAFPRNNARYTLLRFPGPADDVARLIESGADEVVTLPPRLRAARERLAAAELDVLLYVDIGMDPCTYFLAFARLAPVQCVTIGQPVTTGVPTIDYFLSCDRLESAQADAHYSERLVRLRNMPHYFVRQEAQGTAGRDAYPVPADARWYVCQQTLFKVHPEFDELLGQILRADPGGFVILFDGQVPQWKPLLQRRFQRSIPDVAGRIVFLPRLPRDEYLRFLPLADVLLDTIHFGGGTTTLQSIGLGVPLVTLPGEFNRGRGTYSVYRKLEIGDCVASDGADYVRRAVAIANDRALRESIRERILERSHALFSNRQVGVELESFFAEAVSRGAPPGP